MYGLGAETMGPPVDPNQPVQAPDVQQQIADVWSYLFEHAPANPPESIAPASATPIPSSNLLPWIPGIPNSITILGGVAILGLLLMGSRRR